ncbi:CIA30 family protein [Tenacibaculum mesophilum]|nr:CIA30 family protein [Tenacibaculum mesophilum]GFD71381.1 exonuclease [Tenacibaculum sp. KUL113]GFD81441.1 exonuclease [Tenacibaculum sp. KUL118]GFE00461.1 exonuclease [Alteromonas sp. KUL156]
MKWLLILSFLMCLNDEIIIFDKDNNTQNWYVVNDTVMGGISTSAVKINDKGNLIFSGKVSTENNGGFSMTRMPIAIGLNKQHSKIVLKVKGDGKQYQLRLKSNESQRYSYVQAFRTNTQEQEITLPLTGFYPTFRGRKLNFGNFSDNQIEEVAILIGNKKDEDFSLEIIKIAIQ